MVFKGTHIKLIAVYIFGLHLEGWDASLPSLKFYTKGELIKFEISNKIRIYVSNF